MEPNNKVTDRKPNTASETVSAAAGKSLPSQTEPAAAAQIPGVAAAGVTETGDTTPLVNFADVLDILATSKSRSSGGAKIRPNIGYTLVAEKLPSMRGTNVPEQEQVIVKILMRALTVQKPVISEVELNKLVVAAHESGALKTKQDAWHIFRYYRTDLIKRGVLKQVEFAAAA